MSDLFAFTVFGLVTGAIYAVAASGLVVTYTTSGIFNFAHGAVGMLAAFTYWELRVNRHLPAPVALAIVLLVLAPLLGALIERVVIRRLVGASQAIRLIVPVGLLVMFIQVAIVVWPAESRPLERFFGNDATVALPADVAITWHEILTLVLAGAVALGLTALLKGTRVGISMRAVVDNRDLSELNGASPGRASALSWAIGFSLAALAGLLLAPKLQLTVLPLTFLVVNAYAAALFGRLRSLPMTFVGGLVLGLVESYAIGYLDPSRYSWLEGMERWVLGLSSSVPVIVLFVILLAMPGSQVRSHAVTRVRERMPRPQWRSALVGAVALVAGVGLLMVVIAGDRTNIGHVTTALAYGMILLSLVPLTGYGGQISLAQFGLAGVGAVVVSHWHIGGPFEDVLALVAAFAISGAVGALVALPALRLRGVYLALSTFAFAVLLDQVIFRQSWAFGSSALSVERFELFGLSLESDESYAVFLAAMVAIVALGMVALRRGPFGRRLQAMKDSPAACATLGIDLTLTKLQVFALSAGIAGVGGALLAGRLGTYSPQNFEPTLGLIAVLMAVAGGIAAISGAIVGGAMWASLDFWVSIAPESLEGLVENVMAITPGLIGVSLGWNPDGLVAAVSSSACDVRRSWSGRADRRSADVPGDEPEGLGVDRPLTPADLAAIDRILGIDGAVARFERSRA